MTPDVEFHPHRPLTGRGVYLLDDHEVVRRGLRQLLESEGLSIAGESASARKARRQIRALRPELVIVDDDLNDGSGAGVCRDIAAADPGIRCVMMTGESDEGVLIDSILAGAWGRLSKQDDNSELLRLIRRALAGHTAYSGRFLPALTAPRLRGRNPEGELLLTLTRQEMNVAVGLTKGLTNRQISRELFVAEKTVKTMTSAVLRKLGMTRRSQAAVFIINALNPSDNHSYRSSPFPDLIAEVTAALLNCVSEAGTAPPTDEERARDARRLADALTAI
ncbi:response regulator [Arthrobacter sp. YAF17]|uniref:response regulator n=1 Tax=Arthrobacter sp. YAF17 TaxID=3233077 RepID=UPI003F937066